MKNFLFITISFVFIIPVFVNGTLVTDWQETIEEYNLQNDRNLEEFTSMLKEYEENHTKWTLARQGKKAVYNNAEKNIKAIKKLLSSIEKYIKKIEKKPHIRELRGSNLRPEVRERKSSYLGHLQNVKRILVPLNNLIIEILRKKSENVFSPSKSWEERIEDIVLEELNDMPAPKKLIKKVVKLKALLKIFDKNYKKLYEIRSAATILGIKRNVSSSEAFRLAVKLSREYENENQETENAIKEKLDNISEVIKKRKLLIDPTK